MERSVHREIASAGGLDDVDTVEGAGEEKPEMPMPSDSMLPLNKG